MTNMIDKNLNEFTPRPRHEPTIRLRHFALCLGAAFFLIALVTLDPIGGLATCRLPLEGN